jgi:hypothetical protein
MLDPIRRVGRDRVKDSLQAFLDDSRLGTASGLPHDLSEQPLGDRLLALVVLADLIRMVSHNSLDDLIDRGDIADLSQAFRFGDGRGAAAAIEQSLEQGLPGGRAEEISFDHRHQFGESLGRDTARLDGGAGRIQKSKQLSGQP